MDQQEIADRLEIINLEGEYGPRWDSGDAQGWAALFAEDGVFEMVAAGDMPASEFRGRQALARFCEDVTVHYRGLHILGVPSLQIGGDRARGRTHFHWVGFGNSGGDRHIQRQTSGYCEVDYVRTADGWRMAHRREKPTSTMIGQTYGM
ncbi:nuclear transport factor 2 family protein [Sphingobium aromaticivastans]|uniref:nuclear transport factor 2 family protein n=1 Tax=Sphingobium aromaticivastans TaxID=1778665 RepID=UPI00301AD63B